MRRVSDRVRGHAGLWLCCVGVLFSMAAAQQTLAPAEFQTRRQKIMPHVRDGILLLHARSLLANEDQLFVHGFQQNPSFFYFTGLPSTIGAILALEGSTQESWLFVPTKLSGLAAQMPNTMIAPGATSEAALQIDHVVAWEEFIPFIEQRQKAKRDLVLYTTESYWAPTAESNPAGLGAIEDAQLLWRETLRARWPHLRFVSAKNMIADLRLIKSEREIAVLRRVAEISAAALRQGLRGLRPARAQREVEAEIVCACIQAGGEGPSFWPWVMAGANAVFPQPFAALADYYHLNRMMQAGELVRVDLGCDFGFYKGDVGRTAPVSGKFDAAQREVWNLLIRAYRAGLARMRAGTTREELAQACREEVAAQQAKLQTPLAREAAALLMRPERSDIWHVHGCGLEPGEGRPQVLSEGMIIAFEPTFSVAGQGFYLEDMILITARGYEILTQGLPYTAEEIEAAMAGTWQAH